LNGYEDFCHPNELIGANGPGQFTSFGTELHKGGHDEFSAIYKQMLKNHKFDRTLERGTNNSRYNIMLSGIIGLIGYPLYWAIWVYLFPQPYESPLLRFQVPRFVTHWPWLNFGP